MRTMPQAPGQPACARGVRGALGRGVQRSQRGGRGQRRQLHGPEVSVWGCVHVYGHVGVWVAVGACIRVWVGRWVGAIASACEWVSWVWV